MGRKQSSGPNNNPKANNNPKKSSSSDDILSSQNFADENDLSKVHSESHDILNSVNNNTGGPVTRHRRIGSGNPNHIITDPNHTIDHKYITDPNHFTDPNHIINPSQNNLNKIHRSENIDSDKSSAAELPLPPPRQFSCSPTPLSDDDNIYEPPPTW